jgi:hypothetical protein
MNMATSAKAKASKPTRATNGRPAAKSAMLPYTAEYDLDGWTAKDLVTPRRTGSLAR